MLCWFLQVDLFNDVVLSAQVIQRQMTLLKAMTERGRGLLKVIFQGFTGKSLWKSINLEDVMGYELNT
jgi:uncharacterized membrane protein